MCLHLLAHHLLMLSTFTKFKQETNTRYDESLLGFLDLHLQYFHCLAERGSPIIFLDLAGIFKKAFFRSLKNFLPSKTLLVSICHVRCPCLCNTVELFLFCPTIKAHTTKITHLQILQVNHANEIARMLLGYRG